LGGRIVHTHHRRRRRHLGGVAIVIIGCNIHGIIINIIIVIIFIITLTYCIVDMILCRHCIYNVSYKHQYVLLCGGVDLGVGVDDGGVFRGA
jgi:hypothetical protein